MQAAELFLLRHPFARCTPQFRARPATCALTSCPPCRCTVPNSLWLTCISSMRHSPLPNCSLAALLTYSALGNDLTASVAFPALSLFNLLRFPVMMLPQQVGTDPACWHCVCSACLSAQPGSGAPAPAPCSPLHCPKPSPAAARYWCIWPTPPFLLHTRMLRSCCAHHAVLTCCAHDALMMLCSDHQPHQRQGGAGPGAAVHAGGRAGTWGKMQSREQGSMWAHSGWEEPTRRRQLGWVREPGVH